jgi:hypothetical protein
VAVDLRYAHYWSSSPSRPQVGIMTGLGVTYVHTKHFALLNDSYTLPTVDGDVVDLPRLYQKEDTNLLVETGNIKPSKIKIEYLDID